MDAPEIEGYQVLGEIGQGAAGVVYKAGTPDGRFWAIKVFDSMSSNPALCARQMRRLIDGEGYDAAIPVEAQALESRPALVVMPLLGDEDDPVKPRTLQLSPPGTFGWPFLLQLVAGLEKLHRAKVAHGNLKPGNVFLQPDGTPLVADYATGLMPGVPHHRFSDALLYAPPEQLRNPAGYLEEEGYRWDVYAFGVLAFRLLFGVFPRANDIFTPVCAPLGSGERFEFEADHGGVANALESHPSVAWPEAASDETEAARREVLSACLNLNPLDRPANMMEVGRMFGAIEGELAMDRERKALLEAREKAERRRKGANRRFFATAAMAAALAGGWAVTQHFRMEEAEEAERKFTEYRDGAVGEISLLTSQVTVAEEKRDNAFAERDLTQETLNAERKQALAELQSAQAVNERLFDWLLEEGIKDLPVLEGRKERLGFLLTRIDEQVAGLKERPALANELAYLKLRGAEVALAAGKVAEGERRLAEVLDSGGLPEGAEARARLRLLLLISQRDPAALEDQLNGIDELIRKTWSGEDEQLLRAGGALSLVRARMWEAKGEDAKALEDYLASLGCFQKLEELYPEHPVLAMQVARGYLSAARAAEGEGVAGNPAKLREQAASAFVALSKKEKNPSPEVLYQISSARAGQAIALWQQGDLFGAEKIAREEIKTLSGLQNRMEGDFRVTVDLVSQRGIVATALRDEGKSTEARSILELGISQLEAGLAEHPGNGPARYLVASLKWQLSGVLGQLRDGKAELAMGREARDALKALLEEGIRRPNPDVVRKSLAYLCGDLGHAADLHEQKDQAIVFFKECRDHWRERLKKDGDNLESREGLQWAVERLAEFGVK